MLKSSKMRRKKPTHESHSEIMFCWNERAHNDSGKHSHSSAYRKQINSYHSFAKTETRSTAFFSSATIFRNEMFTQNIVRIITHPLFHIYFPLWLHKAHHFIESFAHSVFFSSSGSTRSRSGTGMWVCVVCCCVSF